MRTRPTISCLLLTVLVASCGALAQDARQPDPKRPETPREAPASAYDSLPDVAKKMIESAEKGADGSFTSLAGIETRGTGPVHVVLIPGLASDWTVWEAFMRRNGERYTMHAVTLPGIGESRAPAMPSPDEKLWSDDVWLLNAERALVAGIDGLKLSGPPVVMGHSMGGHLALRLAERHPEKVSSAVMVDGYAAWPLSGGTVIPIEGRRTMVDNQLTSWFDAAIAAHDGAGLKRMFVTGTINEGRGQVLAEMAMKTPAQVTKRYMMELCAADLTPGLKTLERPVLVLAAIPPAPTTPAPAAADAPAPIDPRDVARETWRTQFAGADRVTLEFIEGSRHFVMDDQPGALDTLLAAFVEKLSR